MANAQHLVGATIEEYQKRSQVTDPEVTHRKPAVELVSALKIISTYERVFRSLELDGIFVKLSKVPGGGVGPS